MGRPGWWGRLGALVPPPPQSGDSSSSLGPPRQPWNSSGPLRARGPARPLGPDPNSREAGRRRRAGGCGGLSRGTGSLWLGRRLPAAARPRSAPPGRCSPRPQDERGERGDPQQPLPGAHSRGPGSCGLRSPGLCDLGRPPNPLWAEAERPAGAVGGPSESRPRTHPACGAGEAPWRRRGLAPAPPGLPLALAIRSAAQVGLALPRTALRP